MSDFDRDAYEQERRARTRQWAQDAAQGTDVPQVHPRAENGSTGHAGGRKRSESGQ